MARPRSALSLALIVLATAGGALVVASPAGTGVPRNDYLLVLRQRAGPFRYVESFQKAKPYAYPSAVAAFGSSTSFRTEYLDDRWLYQPGTAGFCYVTWPAAGVTVKLFSYSGWWPPSEDDPPAPRIDPCSRSALAEADLIGLRLFGARWHNTVGTRVGAPAPPKARLRIRVPSTRGSGYELLALGTEAGRDGLVTAITVTVVGAP